MGDSQWVTEEKIWVSSRPICHNTIAINFIWWTMVLPRYQSLYFQDQKFNWNWHLRWQTLTAVCHIISYYDNQVVRIISVGTLSVHVMTPRHAAVCTWLNQLRCFIGREFIVALINSLSPGILKRHCWDFGIIWNSFGEKPSYMLISQTCCDLFRQHTCSKADMDDFVDICCRNRPQLEFRIKI